MTDAGAAAQRTSDALWRARQAVALLGDRSHANDARRQLADAVLELRHAGVSVDDLALVLSLPEVVIRRLLLRRVA